MRGVLHRLAPWALSVRRPPDWCVALPWRDEVMDEARGLARDGIIRRLREGGPGLTAKSASTSRGGDEC